MAGSFVYFVRRAFDGAIKIGCSAKPSRRMWEHRTYHGDVMMLGMVPGSRELEKRLHRQLDHHRAMSAKPYLRRQRLEREWFRPTPEVMDLVGRMLSSTRTER